MMNPEEALAAARAAARADQQPDELPWSLADSYVSARRLTEWAIIEPDRAEVYSTRRLGRPITALKRLLIRFLGQYLDQVTAQQSRFNAHVAAHVMRLEERVDAIEQAVRERERDDAAPE